MLEKPIRIEPSSKQKSRHNLEELWKGIQPEHQALIAGMFRNPTRGPLLNTSDGRIEVFLATLKDLGEAPFLKWLYVYELTDATVMSHASINEVLDALGYAANTVMKERVGANQNEIPAQEQITTEPRQPSQPVENEVTSRSKSERLILGRDSILKKIPANVSAKQAVFLDGIRHAAEIMDIAYGRLQETLTQLALHPPTATELPDISAHVFLDAWSFIDAVDRFRMLYTNMPGIQFGAPKSGAPTFLEVTQVFRKLRNVAAHLAAQADKVVSENSSAWGVLTWFTVAQLQPEIVAWHCTLRPGTLQSLPPTHSKPVIATLNIPTDSIQLAAGGFTGNLSEIRSHVATRIRHLEKELQRVFQGPNHMEVRIINDMFSRRPVKPVSTALPQKPQL